MISLTIALSATVVGFVLVWQAVDAQHSVIMAAIGGVLLGGGLAVGLIGR